MRIRKEGGRKKVGFISAHGKRDEHHITIKVKELEIGGRQKTWGRTENNDLK